MRPSQGLATMFSLSFGKLAPNSGFSGSRANCSPRPRCRKGGNRRHKLRNGGSPYDRAEIPDGRNGVSGYCWRQRRGRSAVVSLCLVDRLLVWTGKLKVNSLESADLSAARGLFRDLRASSVYPSKLTNGCDWMTRPKRRQVAALQGVGCLWRRLADPTVLFELLVQIRRQRSGVAGCDV